MNTLHKSFVSLNVEWQDIVEQLITVSPDTSLTEAIALMNEKHSSCVAVTEAGKLQGIFTERDLVRLVAAKQDLEVAIADVIEQPLVVVSSAAKVKLSQLVSLLKKHSIEHLPILDGETIVGIITDRSLSEVQLRDSEAKYRAIFEQAAVGIVQTGTDKRLLRVNPKFCQMLGYTAEELQQLTFTDITYDRDRQSDNNDFNRFLAGEIATLVKEKRYVHRNGSIVWVKITLALVNDADSPDYFIAIIEDISDCKQAELALKESETRFFDMVNSFPFPVWVSDETGTCSFFNRAWLDFTGKTLEQELDNGWSQGIHPQDLQRCLKIYQSAFDKRQTLSMEYRLRRFDSKYRWILDSGQPRYKSDGSFAGFVGSCIDIDDRVTAKIEREQLLQSIEQKKQFLEAVLQQMPAGVVIASAPDGKIVLSNQQVEPILRHPLIPINKIEDYARYGLSADGQRRKAEDYPIVKALRGKTTAGEESQYLCGDGIIRTMFINAAPIFDSKSQIIAAVATFDDITELKQTQAIAKDAENKALMLKEVNHRIKNNLQIVSALLDLQSEQIAAPEIVELLSESQARIQTIALIHEQLCTSEDCGRIKLSDYVRSLTLYLQKSLVPREKQIDIIYDMEAIEIDIDNAVSYGLIINELVTNSLKHGFINKASGTIKIYLHYSGNNSICLVVDDNGIGMAQIDIDNIQSLGLSLVKSLVTTQLGGDWSIQSSNGTTFAIKIPVI